jgi:hypothetical protein
MALTIVEGFTWANGNTVMPTRLNNAIRSLSIQMAASKLLGTTGAGAAIEIGYTAAGLAVLQAADAAAQRTALGLGSAAVLASTAFDAAGAAAAAQAASQPLDTDLTAIAALTTTSFGRDLLTQADAAAVRTYIGVSSSGSSQPVDALLTAIAALTTSANKLIYCTGSDTVALADLTAFARTILDDADAAAVRTTLGLGGAAVLAVGTTGGTVAAGDDSRLTNSRQCNNNFDSAATARGNLGLGSLATKNVTVDTGDPSGTPADGDLWLKYTA